jgi:integrase
MISGFSSFKQQLGYGPETDLHSFRRTLITELENLGCPEAVTADIVGHKKQTITYGLYSGGSRLELMRHWLAQVRC